MVKNTNKPKTKKELKMIPIYSTQDVRMGDSVEIICKADIKINEFCFKQSNVECYLTNRFNIVPGFLTIEDPDNITVMIENLWTHEPYNIHIGDKIADLVIFAGPL